MRIFIQVLNPCLHFTSNSKFSIPTYIEEILEQLIILYSHAKLNFSSNPYFYSIPPKNITDKFTIIRNVCIFLQPGLISYTRFEKKSPFSLFHGKFLYKDSKISALVFGLSFNCEVYKVF